MIQIGKAFLTEQARRRSTTSYSNVGERCFAFYDKGRKANRSRLNSSLFSRSMAMSTSEVRRKICCEENPKQNQSVHSILCSSSQLLEESNISEPDLSVCHLLSFALKDDFQWKDNGFSILHKIFSGEDHKDENCQRIKNKLLTDEELNTFSKMIQRRLTNEPLQYIIGQWDFHDITIKIRQPCLCPRPETEQLVDIVGKEIRNKINYRKSVLEVEHKVYGRDVSFKKVRVLDVGCGSGAISIALANAFSPEEVEFVAIDVAKEAIQLTMENADMVLGEAKLSTSNPPYFQSFLCSADEFTNLNKKCEKNASEYYFDFDIVVSNPPYIPKQDMTTLDKDVVEYEDYGALCGGDDGLDVVRDIVNRLPEWCSKDHIKEESICWMEVDTSHPQLIENWLTASDSNIIQFVEGLNDFYGLPRFVKIRINNTLK